MQQSLHPPLNCKLRMGLIGGGRGFIGGVHAMAAQLDGRAELVAGALSSDAERAKAAAARFSIDPSRAYGSYRELLQAEAELPGGQRVDFVTIATPNHTHFEIARAALEAGFHVVCEKPLTTRLRDAETLARLVRERQLVFALMHNYSGYPLVRLARELVASGELGDVQAVRTHYLQGWLCGFRIDASAPRGVWKSDPQQAGSGSLGDIATHAFHLARFVTGLEPKGLSAKIGTFHPERLLDDYGQVHLDWGAGRLGAITFSQITHGRLNDLSIEVDGTRASLVWRQEQPNQLVVRRTGQPTQVYERHPAASYSSDAVRAACRLPGGHPEGFIEAFANVYSAAFDDMVQRRYPSGDVSTTAAFPNVQDGVAGVRFVELCLQSAREGGAWKPWPQPSAL